MARRKKKHICAECNESFNHGIGLRKHQRQTGHKGSKIVEDGGEGADAPKAPKAADPPKEAEPPPAAAAPPPADNAVVEEPSPAPAAEPAPTPSSDDDDRTVAVPRPQGSYVDTGYQAPAKPQGPTKLQDTKQKLSLVGSGLKVVLSARAKGAGQQLKKSARSGADIFREALKLAVALVCFLAIPTFVFFWYKSHERQQTPKPDRVLFRHDDGALAARSTLLRYLDHLGKGELDSAYALLSPAWQQDLPSSGFRDAFLDIEDVRWAVSDQRLNPSGEADVLVRLAYREGGKSRRFIGRFRLSKGTQGWRIDRAELSPDRTS